MTQPSLTSSLREVESELGVTISAELVGIVTVTLMVQSSADARHLYSQYRSLMGKYSDEEGLKTKFGVSTQHYSFAILLWRW